MTGAAGAAEGDGAGRRIDAIDQALEQAYGEVAVPLRHASPFELLIATILSAQTTDEQVNRVTPELFERYPDAASLADAELDDLHRILHSTGFFRAKARNVLACAGELQRRFNGIVPRTIDELTTLAGVGRKTANVIVGSLFGAPAIVADTHFMRVVRRLDLTDASTPEQIERDVRGLIAPSRQTGFSMRVNRHGRVRCMARRPDCEACEIAANCPRIGVSDAS